MGKSEFYGWKLLAAFWVIYLVNLAFPTYGSSVINPYMAEDLHLDRKMLGAAFSVYMLMTGLPGPLIAQLVNRIGVRLTLVLGSCLVLAGSVAMATAVQTGWQAIIGFGIVIALGSAAGGTIAEQAGIARWFTRRRAMALSIMYSAGGIGGFIAAPLIDRVITGSGGNWRIGWWMIAVLACVSAVLSAWCTKERPSDLGQFPDGITESPDTPGLSGTRAAVRRGVYITSEEWTCREAFRSGTMIKMILAAAGISAGFTLFMAHGVVHLKDLGHSPAAAAMSISVMVISTLIGKLAAGFGDRYEPRYIWALAAVFFGLGMMLLPWATRAADLYPYAILLGFGWGTNVVGMMTVLINYFGQKAYPAVVGIMLLLQTGIGAISPIVAGHMFDRYGSYTGTFYVIAAMCLAGSILLLTAKPPTRVVLRTGANGT